ncbi:hypothetical protein AAIR98_001378 [Elusimicrobium simillimum]
MNKNIKTVESSHMFNLDHCATMEEQLEEIVGKL